MPDLIMRGVVVVVTVGIIAIMLAAVWVSLLVDEGMDKLRPCDAQDLRSAGREGRQEAHDGQP